MSDFPNNLRIPGDLVVKAVALILAGSAAYFALDQRISANAQNISVLDKQVLEMKEDRRRDTQSVEDKFNKLSDKIDRLYEQINRLLADKTK
ncbi:hypothetical protein [Pseudomonas sp. URMO17WK12:I11]|jgi:TolA-binding protein|uniref:hypothetical protein n=1 Tax=Pseudomonas sp. URMO17WK12:I11 TaxID=1283291 RepID=UPI0011A7636F|nr:hypothetical protein [Pseudomonas sp. URMO17WK12:I11]